MAAVSLYEKLLAQMGERGLLQAARAEGTAVKAGEDIPQSVMERIASKNSGTRMERPEYVGREPTQEELDAIEKSNAGSDVAPQFKETPEPAKDFSQSAEDIESESNAPDGTTESNPTAEQAGLSKMLKGMGAAGVAGGAGYMGYKAMNSPQVAGPVQDAGLEGGTVPGAPKTLKEAVQASTQQSNPSQPRGPSVPMPEVPDEPAPYTAGKYNFDDTGYQQKLQQLQDKEEAAKNQYQSDKTTNAWGDVAEKIAHAVAQYGAGRQGLRNNVDLSGLKFDSTNWQDMTKQDAADLEREQKSLGHQRETAKENFGAVQGASREQFGREEAARNANTGEENRRYNEAVKAKQAAQLKQAELQIQDARDDRKRGESMEDFTKRQAIEHSYQQPKESPQAKLDTKRTEALSGLQAAYLSGDDKEIAKQRLAATKFLTPPQIHALDEASSSFFGGHKKAAKVIEEAVAAPSGGPSGPKGGAVVFEVNGRRGAIPADQADVFQAKHPNAKRIGQ